MPSNKTTDLLIVGGGVIGLSIAYELAKEGLQIRLLDRGQIGGEASWAGAGMIPPGSWYSDHPALESMAEVASQLYPLLSKELFELTGIENGFWNCGARYDKSPRDRFCKRLNRWRELGIKVDEHEDHYWVPSESQIRNPRHLKSLRKACEKKGVTIQEMNEVQDLGMKDGMVTSVHTSEGTISAGLVVITAGCWSSSLISQLGFKLPSRPLRGQMVLIRPETMPLDFNWHRHPYYLVPRRDGLLLVGATVEHVGFDRRTTKQAFDDLIQFCRNIDPRLGVGTVEGFWSGLRPDSPDGLPTIGQLPNWDNVWVACGHSRAGLQFAPPTAKIIANQILDKANREADEAFSPERFSEQPLLSC